MDSLRRFVAFEIKIKIWIKSKKKNKKSNETKKLQRHRRKIKFAKRYLIRKRIFQMVKRL